MDKLEHFLKKNQHRIVHYFTTKDDNLAYVMVLSINDGVMFMVDLKDGFIPFIETGSFQKRFYVHDLFEQKLPENIQDQPIDQLIRDDELLKMSLKVLQRKQTDGNLMVIGPNYIIDSKPDGTYNILGLTDFPDTLEQHGLFQKYDLEYFYNHKHTISQSVKMIYDKLHLNFLENLEVIKTDWDQFSKDPTKHLAGIETLLTQYDERTKQCNELKKLIMNMYQIWKQLTSEYDMLEVQLDPISFDQNLQMNQKKQMLYRKLDRIKLIEKHATDLLLKIHISSSCLLFYIHLLSCEMGSIRYRIDRTSDIQNNIQKFVLQTPSAIMGYID